MANLYIIPTPIGNMGDFTLRSIEILKSVKYIFCEDTKVFGKIKNHFKLNAKLISLHKFNEISRLSEIKKILINEDIAIVSDAGTPTISDPGQILIKEIKKEKINVIPLPGPNAITTAISGSGLEFTSFSFVGFLEKEKNKIIETIVKNINSDLIVCYESPNRINKTLNFLFEKFGNISNIVIAREISKVYEEIINNDLIKIKDKEFKGEIVLIIPTKGINLEKPFIKIVDKLISFELEDKKIIEFLSSTLNYKKNDIYNYLKTKKKYN